MMSLVNYKANNMMICQWRSSLTSSSSKLYGKMTFRLKKEKKEKITSHYFYCFWNSNKKFPKVCCKPSKNMTYKKTVSLWLLIKSQRTKKMLNYNLMKVMSLTLSTPIWVFWSMRLTFWHFYLKYQSKVKSWFVINSKK